METPESTIFPLNCDLPGRALVVDVHLSRSVSMTQIVGFDKKEPASVIGAGSQMLQTVTGR